MNLKIAVIHRLGLTQTGPLSVDATIVVEGLGEVKIQAALSAELCQRIEEEAIAALRVRLGQSLKEGT